MTERKQIWKCGVCGNIVEVLHKGADALVCCGVLMELMGENFVDAAEEKHVPIIEGRGEGVGGSVVRVGSVVHPMEEGHYIEWIEATGSGVEVAKKFLKAGDSSEVEFCFEVVSARCYCNLHGLWKS